MTTSQFNLEPMTGSAKSFYGKAQIRAYGDTGIYSLISYGTEIAAGTMAAKGKPATMYRIFDGTFEDEKGGWSATSGRHLESFSAFLGGGYKGRKDWMAKEYTTISAVLKSMRKAA